MNRILKTVGTALVLVGVLAGISYGQTSTDNLYVTNNLTQTSSTATNSFAGRMGIGLTAPTEMLHVKNAYPLRIDDSSGNALYWVSKFLYPQFQFYNNGTLVGRLSEITTPFFAPSYLGNEFAVGTNTTYASFSVKSPSTNQTAFFAIDSDSTNGLFRIDEDATGNGEVYLCDSSRDETVCLSSSGNSYLTGGDVGIGTNSPSETFHIAGTMRANDGITYISALGDIPMGTHTNQ